MYLGKSDQHANTVGRILNLSTGHISPKYYFVYDILFSTVSNSEGGLGQDGIFDPIKWNQLIHSGYERGYQPEYDENGRLLPGPVLQDEWLSGAEKDLPIMRTEDRDFPDLHNEAYMKQTTPPQRERGRRFF